MDNPVRVSNQNIRNAALLTLLWLGGLVAVFLVLRTPSEPGSSFLFGYSLIRLSIGGLTLAVVTALIIVSVAEAQQPAWWQRLSDRLTNHFASESSLSTLGLFLFTVFLVLAAVLILAVSPASQELVVLKTVLNYLGLLLIWVEVAIPILFLMIVYYPGLKNPRKSLLSPIRLAILFLILTIVYTAALKVFMTYTWDIRMRRLENYIFIPALLLLSWGLLHHFYRDHAWYASVSRIFFLITLGVCTYTVYRHTAQWMEWQNTPSKAYWGDLAEAFLNFRLYIPDQGQNHDLTFYQGNWYVPNPPLPALVLLPFVAILGKVNINMVLFSITWGAINAVLVYLILEKATQLGLIPTGRSANLLVTLLFAFGTSHWWLAIMGRMWFLSQILTLFFAGLALYLVLHKASPWLVGLCLGLSMLSRPNAFTLWPFLAGVAIYLFQRADGKIDWRRNFAWSIQTAVPMSLAVAGLLYYNDLRFGNFFDFGYVSINSSEWLMEAVTNYGIFNPYFVPTNLNVMFFKLPILQLREGCLYFSPTREGASMIAMTPALIYVFRRFKLNWWTVGAWTSVILSLGLLMFYHNTGAWQLGYRYLMDFILPILLLLGLGVGKRIPWLFSFLTIVSILFMLAGIIWWFEKWWC